MKTALFQVYGIGFAAENLKVGVKVLEVVPLEAFPTVDGEINTDLATITTVGITGDSTDYSDKASIGYTVPATWLGGGYQVTAPNIRRGERVVLYKLGDGKKLYWRSLGMDNIYRRLETVVLAISAIPDNGDVGEFDPENSYFLEVSSHKKLITFATSMMNNEKAGYTFQINTGEGLYVFEDDKGNNITHDSVNTRYTFTNVDGLSLDMYKKDLTLVVPENISISCENMKVAVGKSIDITSTTFSLNASESIKLGTASTTLTSSDTITFDTNELTSTAGSKTTVKAPIIILDGVVQCTNTVTAVGAVTGAALAIAAGGGMSKDGTLTANKAEVGESTIGALNVQTIQAGTVEATQVNGLTVTSGGRAVLTA